MSEKSSRWNPQGKANRRLLELIREGEITEENVNDDKYLTTVFYRPDNAIFREHSVEKFMKYARKGVEMMRSAKDRFGKSRVMLLPVTMCLTTC